MRISQREKAVLGYTHTSSSISQSSSSQYPDASPPHRNSEIDFSDVFGGPPRRSGSFQDLHRRFHEDKNDVSNGDGSDVLTGRRSEAGNPPVFGTEVHSRRRYPSEDFYNDIFGGDHLSPLSSSPRTSGGKNPFYSVPGSRVLSPTRPSVLGVDPLGSLAQFSLPARLISTVQPSSTSYRPSPLSSNNLQEFSSRGAKATTTEVDGLPSDEETKRTSSVSNDHNQFHFSIYKWASKGVPLSMSLRSGGTRLKKSYGINKLERSLGSNHSIETDTLITEIQPENLKVDDDIIMPTEQVIKASAESKQDEGASRTPSMKFNDNVVARTQNSSRKAELKPSVNIDTNANADRSLKLKESIRAIEEQMELFGDGRKVEKENIVRRNIKSKGGKVKEFTKIFNKDSSVKSKNHGRSIDVDSLKAENQESAACWAKKQAFNVDGGSAGSFKDDGIHVSSGGESVPGINETDQQDNLASTNGEVPRHTKESSANNDVIDEASISIEEMPEMDEITTEINEEHQILDSNVVKWSNGKEGNIRALLSTLQYVLWPNSGWKPVPLVDIIESSSVKRTYQRALLCLHPDKLQQKGAASDQKYIAARVFDVLQEAWDQFNSLGSL